MSTKVKKIIKKVISGAIIATVAVTAFSINAGAVGNVQDTDFAFTFSDWGRSRVVHGRDKEDRTSFYLYATQLPSNGFQAYADGSNYLWNGPWENCTDNIYGKHREYYEIKSTYKEYFLRNLVYEKGYSYGWLGGYRPNGEGYAYGVWSPDCC